jgi:hypothetical protein
MFVKATRVTSGGRQLTYLQLVESYRDGGRVRQRVIAKLGLSLLASLTQVFS